MRLFLALELDAAARTALAEVSASAQRAAGDLASALRWVPAENLHVTLHFLGEVDAAGRARALRALEPPAAAPAADVQLGSLATFPPSGPPRVLVVSLAPPGPLERIYREFAARLSREALAVEDRPFHPHVTLARVRDRDRRRTRGLWPRVGGVSVPHAAWRVDHVTLFESDLSGPQPVYIEIGRAQLP